MEQLAACADDLATRIYRADPEAAAKLRAKPDIAGLEWAGAI